MAEQEIAQRMGLSRTPVREAMRKLEQDGFLVGVGSPRRAQRIVAPLTAADLVDLYNLVAVLEGEAARVVAKLPGPTRHELGLELQELEATYKKLGSEEAPDYDRLFEAHNAVHIRFVESSDSPRLRRILDTIRPQIDRYEYNYAPLVGPDYHDTFEEHDEMVYELHSGTPDGAEHAVRRNWVNSGTRLLAAIKRTGPKGDW